MSLYHLLYSSILKFYLFPIFIINILGKLADFFQFLYSVFIDLLQMVIPYSSFKATPS